MSMQLQRLPLPPPPSAFVKVKSAVVLAFHFNKLIKIVQIGFVDLKYDFFLVTTYDDHWLGPLNFTCLSITLTAQKH